MLTEQEKEVLKQYIKSSQNEIKKKEAAGVIRDTVDSVIDYAIDSARRIIINVAQSYLHKYFPRIPRVY